VTIHAISGPGCARGLRRFAQWVCIALAQVTLAQAASAPSVPFDVARVYPVRPIRFIVAAPPGGAADTVTRLISPKLAEVWRQPVVIDNRPGANGIIGTVVVARAAPDGYTIIMAGAGLAINPSLYKQAPYDPVHDFSPVTQVVSVSNMLVVHPSVPAASVLELVQLAKAHPGELRFASAGNGTSGHLAGELFKSMAGVQLLHVPYKSGGPALADVAAGQVQMMFSITLAAVPQVKAGKLRALAVTSARRSAAAPDIPTVAESGFPGYEVTGWFGVLAPAATPRTIVAKLNGEIVRILNMPDIRQRLLSQGADPAPGTSEQFAVHIGAESQKWAKLIKQAGIRAN
jgi:tripartite-type tricarboxylate transporter receptor subunit TctC